MITERQKEILDFFSVYQHRHGMPPTVREVGAHFDMASTNAAICHFKALEKKGLMVRERGGISRAWRLPAKPTGKVCPHCGGSL